ncbi:MAG: L-threonylcarbamoyladenylate synthase [Planctomycetota bacterium]
MIVAADEHGIARAARVLADGGLVVFPTETVYGLGGLAHDPDAVARIYSVKGRPSSNPLIVHVAGVAEARSLAGDGWNPVAEALAGAFWPGPLTLVLPRGPGLADAVTAGGPTMALRVPAHPVARELLRACGKPVVAPSANSSGRLSPTLACHAWEDLGGRVDLILDGGACLAGVESTVVDATTRPARLLRPGPVSPMKLEEVLGRFAVGPGSEAVARSPGLETRHYAPRTKLLAVATAEACASLAREARAGGRKMASLAFGATPADMILPGTPAEAERALFAALHRLDSLGLDLIAAVLPPDEPRWWAVRDRLARASAS